MAWAVPAGPEIQNGPCQPQLPWRIMVTSALVPQIAGFVGHSFGVLLVARFALGEPILALNLLVEKHSQF
jgi:hypothetical protein